AELDKSEEKHHPEKFSDFRKVLEQSHDRTKHPSRRYFVLKSIVLGNLYGVDIMAEAVEICKLRLFLKLVAQVEEVERIEPLPDIDFNIQAGNTLVGFTSREHITRAMTMKGKTQIRMLSDEDTETMRRIEEKAEDIDHLFALFRQQQTGLGGEVTPGDKEQLRDRLRALEDELNVYLAGEYGVATRGTSLKGTSLAYQEWLDSHQPFHWFVEFYGIMKDSGFDVIIGNPPYVEYSKIRNVYTVRGYETEECGNLFPLMVERASVLASDCGRVGMILQHSGFCTPRMQRLIESVRKVSSTLHVSFYECRPGKLFDGIDVRLAIALTELGETSSQYLAGPYYRFFTEERPSLFQITRYADATTVVQPYSLLKTGTDLGVSIAKKLFDESRHRTGDYVVNQSRSVVYYSYGFRYWAKALNYEPYFRGERADTSTGDKRLYLRDGLDPDLIVCIMNSSLFYWYYSIYSDGHNFTKTVIYDFPFDYPSASIGAKLSALCNKLMKDLERNSRPRVATYKSTGRIEYAEYYAYRSKTIIDEIDRVLAQHYGFTDEELDYIINYDIKYRMGKDSLENEE
ncbi:MAG: Eco57I restriction-modification methylase domain-containing protein, partial [Chloroflexi bacterium]|nr:Eco57I restriction-modification methylase domain-containing protein [Chloroflexota bacterium]